MTNISAVGPTMTADFWVIRPQLQITKTASPSSIFVGENATITVTARNVRNTAALNPSLFDSPLGGLTLISGNPVISANYLWGSASPPSVDIYVRDTNTWINSSESQWCSVTQIDANTWQFNFEDLKGQPRPDYDFNQPLLTVRKDGHFYSVTLERYDGDYHSDIYVGDVLFWSGAAGV